MPVLISLLSSYVYVVNHEYGAGSDTVRQHGQAKYQIGASVCLPWLAAEGPRIRNSGHMVRLPKREEFGIRSENWPQPNNYDYPTIGCSST